MKKKLFILAAVLLAIVLLVSATAALADFGGFSGDTDYGGSSDSGSSGWDWGGSDSGSSGWDWSSGSGSGGFSLFPVAGCTGGGIMFIMVIVFIIVLIAILRSKAQQQQTQHNAHPTVVTSVKPTDSSQLTPIENYIAEVDEGFSVSAMESKLSNLYVQMQDSWCKKDITSLRPYLTDELYTQSDRQLDEIRRASQTPHIERIAVLGVTIRGWFQREGMDHIIAQLETRITTYSTSDLTGEIVKGNPNIEKFMTYEWELTRTSGVLTQAEEELKTVTCPNCGAPVSINKSAKCPYCDTVITLAEHDWVLSSIKGLSQKSVG